MRYDKGILQKFIKYNGEYLVGKRYIPGNGRCEDSWETILLSPNVKREFCVDDIGTLSFDKVTKFADEDIESIIHLGKKCPPFQYGITRDSFVNLEKITCDPMELIVKCYQEDIQEYTKVLDVMKRLTIEEVVEE